MSFSKIFGGAKIIPVATFNDPEQAVRIARKLAAFGESADSIPDTLRRVGDIASGTQSSISELAEIYGKARIAGTLFNGDIDQLTSRGIPIIQEFAKQLGVTESPAIRVSEPGANSTYSTTGPKSLVSSEFSPK